MVQFDDGALGHALQVTEGQLGTTEFDTDVDADAIQQGRRDAAAAFGDGVGLQFADRDGNGVGVSLRFRRLLLCRRLVLRRGAWAHEKILGCRDGVGEG